MTAHAPSILALETATRAISVALLRGEELVAEECAPEGRPAAECVLPALDAVLTRAGRELASVEAFAVSIGPGSFTSLRVGLATVKGLAFGRHCRVLPVSTLAALALAVPEGGLPVVPMLDARRGEVYAAAFLLEGGEPRATLEEGVYAPAELARRLPAACVLVGDGVAVAGAAICERLGPGVRLAPSQTVPRARHVGLLGARELARGRGVDAAELVPRYLRRAEAEVQRTGERFEPTSESS